MTFAAFLCGVIVGATAGILVVAIAVAASDGDDRG